MSVTPATIAPVGQVLATNDLRRHRSWCFTSNNYDQPLLDSLSTLPVKYIVYGKEVAPTTRTPHLQGFVCFPSAKTRSAVGRLIPRSHLLVARGTGEENFRYCSKGGDFVERGDRPLAPSDGGDIERIRWDDVWASAKRGAIEEIPAEIRLKYYSGIRRIERDFMPAVAGITSSCGYWIHGVSGSGKTRSVLDAYPEAYPKPLSKWWDGYQSEPVVYLDDVDPSAGPWLGRFLKLWADRYPFIAEIKGGSRKIRPARFLVTSQYTIAQCFSDPHTIEALERRFTVIEKILGQNIILPQ